MEDKVIKGKEGFLFLQNDTNDVIGQITGKRSLTKNQLLTWLWQMERRQVHAAKCGYRYKYLIIPNKHCVYPQYLPDDIQISSLRPALQLIKADSQTFDYPLPLLANYQNGFTYYRTDTHWNDLGAILTLNNFLGDLSGKIVAIDVGEELAYCGDLGEKLKPKMSEAAAPIEFPIHHKIIYDNRILNTGRLLITDNEDKSLPIGVIFGDSFFTRHIALLAEYFSRLYYMHASLYDYGIIERISPDIVISENIERFLPSLPPREDATLRDLVYRKFFRSPAKGIVQFGEVVQENDPVSGIDCVMLHSYKKRMSRCVDEDQFEQAKIDFQVRQKFAAYLPGHNDEDFQAPLAINKKAGVAAWARAFTYARFDQPLGLGFILANLHANSELVLKIYEAKSNSDFYEPDEADCIYEKRYSKEDLAIQNDIQEVFLETSEINLSFNRCYIAVIAGDAELGCGISQRRLPRANYLYRGYFRLVGGVGFKALSNGDGLALKVVY